MKFPVRREEDPDGESSVHQSHTEIRTGSLHVGVGLVGVRISLNEAQTPADPPSNPRLNAAEPIHAGRMARATPPSLYFPPATAPARSHQHRIERIRTGSLLCTRATRRSGQGVFRDPEGSGRGVFCAPEPHGDPDRESSCGRRSGGRQNFAQRSPKTGCSPLQSPSQRRRTNTRRQDGSRDPAISLFPPATAPARSHQHPRSAASSKSPRETPPAHPRAEPPAPPRSHAPTPGPAPPRSRPASGTRPRASV
ncbi:hypothetical protein ENSA5_25220 [Enhygromyxa salina]|uniref:Uncharacterized protein n=1 Tax=Enhygromyxa salina TaxID=215803 RepID=A0A2S9YAP9_9BACT|nr:hypothetical protein ENSA5_25220 [Enhygromyxa salina]